MLKRVNRMGRNKEFDRAFKLGQSFYGKMMGLKAIDNGLALTRLGILISTKVSKKAPIRNKYKRRIREIIRQELPALRGGKDVVIVVFPQILESDYEGIRLFLKSGLRKLNLYK